MDKHDAKVDHLAKVKLFRGCTRRELEALARITTDVTVPAGKVLCREGEIGHECFIVVEGEATVSIDGDHVATVGSGGFFGELALLDGGQRVATVTASTEMELYVLNNGEFYALLNDVPTVSRRMLEALGARLREADSQLHGSRVGI